MSAVMSSARPNPLLQALAKNRLSWVGIGLLLFIILAAVLAPWLAPHDPLQQNIAFRLEPPSAQFWLGTDSYGRDVLSRLIYGARVSLLVGFVAIMIAMCIGSALGILAGYVGGVIDQVIMGLVDVLLSFSTLLLGLMIAAMLGASLENLIIAIAITEIAPFVRVARAPTIALKQRDFVEAGRALGYGPLRLMGVHILPNMISDVVVLGSLWMASAIRTEASLSFIGLGVPPPAATWGSMIREGFENILDAWWLTVFPSLAILLTVLALNLLGDALRDAIDPKLRSERS
ncbi:ABC transporter permease [Bordetella holmesii]|uniref:ABC transporter, permease protein n=2 Tax=Bordetella holmesii TaxID=35814 RepID=A0A158M4N6_9BORD|nr:ABC transporter permease [Bordetella holmesii]AHV91521.1 binding--dependent transport system inner membrane component family protein [Bordetella holmesii ATCC 51541]AIT25569.1 binding--dependent transport system inner membrane component family protein [Bordetella holmesii 44057]AMD44733.1 ABC transporter permease [Bordetella holmesii H558]AMD49797.1 diguanylate cyclase [Bordetella holmesii F627]EWM44425.1 binding--dependent transport system inner membrane component family protein [Bordetell